MDCSTKNCNSKIRFANFSSPNKPSTCRLLHKCDDHHHFLDLAPTREIFMDRFRARLSGENGAFVGSLF